MKIRCLGKRNVTLSILMVMLVYSPFAISAEKNPLAASKIATQLDLSLPAIYIAPPPAERQTNLNISQNAYYGSLDGLKSRKIYPYGYQQLKLDKSMRVRGWKVKDQFYVGQTRVGKKWGLGMMMTQGNFAYGLNNKGVGMIYSGENSVYRINMQGVSLDIDF